MLKKAKQKKHLSSSKAKSIGYYLRMYTVSVTAGFIVFLVGSFFTQPEFSCANSKTCHSDLSLHIDNGVTGTFQGHTVLPPTIDLAYDTIGTSVLGTNTPDGEKHIYVDQSAQKLYAFQGKTKVMETFIASGKWKPTPEGNFRIWEKLRATRMSGGEGADAYDLPNVPYVMYFYSDFGIHGAYWHNNFGHKMSHGCVNMRIVDARDLFEWAQVGTAVSVCSSFTSSNNCVQNNPIN